LFIQFGVGGPTFAIGVQPGLVKHFGLGGGGLNAVDSPAGDCINLPIGQHINISTFGGDLGNAGLGNQTQPALLTTW
jgi:hypothetical protein